MATKHEQFFAALARPFGRDEIKLRQAPGGRQLSYVTARQCMNRLDEVAGPENWRDTYTETKEGLKCRLEIRLPDGEWIWREDGGGHAGMADNDDDEKAAFSSAFKRVCVKFLIGRHLYNDGMPHFGGESAPISTRNPSPAANGNGHQDHAPPRRPPDHAPPRRQPDPAPAPTGNAPRTGKALFAWIKDQEAQNELRILFPVNDWAKKQGLPGKMVDWPEDFIPQAYEFALGLIRQVQPEFQNQEPQARPQAQHQNSYGPATRDAGDFALKAQRAKLTRMVWNIASAQNQTDTPTNEHFFKALDGLAPYIPGGEVLKDIEDCRDASLLAAYIDQAESTLAVI